MSQRDRSRPRAEGGGRERPLAHYVPLVLLCQEAGSRSTSRMLSVSWKGGMPAQPWPQFPPKCMCAHPDQGCRL